MSPPPMLPTNSYARSSLPGRRSSTASSRASFGPGDLGRRAARRESGRAARSAYNAGLAGDAWPCPLPLEARIGFSFARDVPKGAAAGVKLVATGTLAMPEGRGSSRPRPRRRTRGHELGALRVRSKPPVRAAVSKHFSSTRTKRRLRPERRLPPKPRAHLGDRARCRDARPTARSGMRVPPADVVVMGQVLSELGLGLGEWSASRSTSCFSRISFCTAVAPGGSLVVVEPALRDRTRHLHAVRDRVLRARSATVFALACMPSRVRHSRSRANGATKPCSSTCLEWLVPVLHARQGFDGRASRSGYLVLRAAGPRSRACCSSRRRHACTCESSPTCFRSKGKTELFSCTSKANAFACVISIVTSTEANEAWGELHRGDVVTLRAPGDATTDPPVDERGRLSRSVEVDVWPLRK